MNNWWNEEPPASAVQSGPGPFFHPAITRPPLMTGRAPGAASQTVSESAAVRTSVSEEVDAVTNLDGDGAGAAGVALDVHRRAGLRQRVDGPVGRDNNRLSGKRGGEESGTQESRGDHKVENIPLRRGVQVRGGQVACYFCCKAFWIISMFFFA